MRIALGTDHAGFHHKEAVKAHLTKLGHEVIDYGCPSDESCDYPDFVGPAAIAVGRGECDRGVVFGGSGNGEAIVANKVRGVRCALCWNLSTAQLGREHNDANVIAIGARQVDEATTLQMIDIWLATPFEGDRHERRLTKVARLENGEFGTVAE